MYGAGRSLALATRTQAFSIAAKRRQPPHSSLLEHSSLGLQKQGLIDERHHPEWILASAPTSFFSKQEERKKKRNKTNGRRLPVSEMTGLGRFVCARIKSGTGA
jgi:hypothetical protein